MNEIITAEMADIRQMIMATVARRNALKMAMQEWYDTHPGERFTQSSELITVDATLSELDSHYKRLWDYHNGASVIA